MRRLLKVTAMSGLLTLLRMAMGFVVVKVVAIYTGPTGMAMLGQFQSIASSLNGLVSAPVGNGIVRFTAEIRENDACAPFWRASIQWLFIILAIIIPVGLYNSENISLWLFKNTNLSWLITITLSLLPLSAIGTLCNSVINGQQQYRRFVTLGFFSIIISSSMMIILIIHSDVHGALLAVALQSAVIGFLLLICNLNQPWCKLKYWWGSCELKHKKQIGGYVLMAITTAVTAPVSLIFVRNMLIEHAGWDAAGQWQAVWKISEVYLGVITVALGTYYLPKLSSLVGVDNIISEINKTAKLIIPLVVVMAFVIYFLRDVAISLLFTEEFRGARDLFLFQLFGDVLKMTAWLYAYPMFSRGATKWYVSNEVIFSISFVLLSYFFVQQYGLIGVAVAYMLNYLCCLIFILINVRRFSR